MSEFPLVKALEKHWEGCGWAELLPIHLPLVSIKLYDKDPAKWKEAVNKRQNRYRKEAERYLREHPEEFAKLMEIPQDKFFQK